MLILCFFLPLDLSLFLLRLWSLRWWLFFILVETYAGDERMLAPSKHRILPLFTWLRLYCPPETFTASLLRVIYCLVFKDLPDLVSHYFPNFTSHCFSNLTLRSSPTKLPNGSPATMPLCTQMALTGIPRAPLHQSISHPSFKDPSQISF